MNTRKKILILIPALLVLWGCHDSDQGHKAPFHFSADLSHQDDAEILATKDRAIDCYSSLSRWHDDTYYGIYFYQDWRMDYEGRNPGSERVLDHIRTKMLPAIKNSVFLTDAFKVTIQSRADTLTSESSLLGLLSGDTVGHSLNYIMPRSTASYQEYLEDEHGIFNTPVEAEFISPLSADSVQECLREMVRLEGGRRAVLSMPYYLIGEENIYSNKFLLFYFVREEEGWLLDGLEIEENHPAPEEEGGA